MGSVVRRHCSFCPPGGLLGALATVAAMLLSACGGGASTLLEGTTATRVVQAPAEGATRYDSVSSAGPALGGETAEGVERGILEAARMHGVSMEGDGRLGLLAAWVAEHLGEGGTPPPHEVTEYFARHLGLVEPVPHLLILGQPEPTMLERGVTDSVSFRLERQPYSHYGCAVVPRDGLSLAVVVLSWRWVQMQTMPRALDPGDPISFRGELSATHHRPHVAVTQPDGSVLRLPADEGRRFDVSVPTREAGVYRVELLAQGPRGDTVVANFPVYVGVEVPQSVSLEVRSGDGLPQDARTVQERLLRELNRSRRDAGLSALQLHEGLTRVSVAHSRDMVDNSFVGHTSPSTGDAADRLRAAGYESGLMLENIGRGYGAEEIHQGLLASPGHRANVLNPDVTHVGIGVVAELDGNRTAYVVTQVYIHMAGEIDVSGAPDHLLGRINDARRARGVSGLEADSNLTAAAQNAAEEFFEDTELTQQDVVDSASGSLRRFAIAYSRVGGLMAVVTRVDDASHLEPTLDPEVGYVGIGVAQGSREDTGPNAIAVVILLAWPR